MEITIRRGFVDTPHGQIHYATAGQGDPVLLLNQTPRSWDEYRDVLPIIGANRRAIAMDTIGFGDSYKPEEEGSIEDYARGVIFFLDGLGIKRTSIVGHHTGGVIAVEVAATHPERVDKLVLSSTPYVNAEDRERKEDRPPIDEVQFKEDGSHLKELWQRRVGFYPENRPDLLLRYVVDALKAGEGMENGHRAVSRYRMEEKTPLIEAATLVMAGAGDPFSYPRMGLLARNIKGSETAVIEGGMVPMVDQMPEEFAKVVFAFLNKKSAINRG
jgi:pimeloyl-ACP methyl ester carboxylesterase